MTPVYDRGGVRLHHCSAAELLAELEPGSVDLIMSDPPYPRKYIECYRDLAVGAVRACKSGAFVYAYCGAYALPELLARMVPPLTWFWLFNVRHDGSNARLNGVNLTVLSKPVLVFTVGAPDYRALRWVDTDTNTTRIKHHHPWQQSENFPRIHIAARTQPGELVCDPFLGSGTTALAARYLGRRFVGCDIDEAAIETAIARLSQDVLPLPDIEQEEQEAFA